MIGAMNLPPSFLNDLLEICMQCKLQNWTQLTSSLPGIAYLRLDGHKRSTLCDIKPVD